MMRAPTRGTLLSFAALLPLFIKADTPKAPAQPIPFSHKRHAESGIRCNMCHPNAARAERAGLPGATQCMSCHTSIKRDSPQVRQIATFHNEQKPIPLVEA
jgi:hypothetical protein